MNHFVVHLKLTQHCKSTILQYKIKIKFKKRKRKCNFQYKLWLRVYFATCKILKFVI